MFVTEIFDVKYSFQGLTSTCISHKIKCKEIEDPGLGEKNTKQKKSECLSSYCASNHIWSSSWNGHGVFISFSL